MNSNNCYMSKQLQTNATKTKPFDNQTITTWLAEDGFNTSNEQEVVVGWSERQRTPTMAQKVKLLEFAGAHSNLQLLHFQF